MCIDVPSHTSWTGDGVGGGSKLERALPGDCTVVETEVRELAWAEGPSSTEHCQVANEERGLDGGGPDNLPGRRIATLVIAPRAPSAHGTPLGIPVPESPTRARAECSGRGEGPSSEEQSQGWRDWRERTAQARESTASRSSRRQVSEPKMSGSRSRA